MYITKNMQLHNSVALLEMVNIISLYVCIYLNCVHGLTFSILSIPRKHLFPDFLEDRLNIVHNDVSYTILCYPYAQGSIFNEWKYALISCKDIYFYSIILCSLKVLTMSGKTLLYLVKQ